ncbi:hypothetical protein [Flavobacterium sp. '19STA2R22 D10 B1']|uniref:hypothetical protein n=1 Tax=Flavobacterium aerium TaxID=3037261 RepID=UPI00278C88A4|nr:hypothetical protein [Flavobacterium sp. '19STA2R22 D10 B1']
MRKLLLIPLFLSISCVSIKDQKTQNEELTGTYILKSSSKYQALSDNKNYSNLEINKDGTYTLNKAIVTFSPVIEQCNYASKGTWSVIAENMIQITSEDYYTKQKGFEYKIKKENKFSQDSLYIKIIFPDDFHPVKLDFIFNHNNSKAITTDKTYIVLSKSKYLSDRKFTMNQINFNLNADVSGTELYKSRILFKIFEEHIDTEKFNFFTISLPNFDRCFFEFESYNQELIYVKNKNELLWQGEIWKQ